VDNLLIRIDKLEERVAELEEAVVALEPMLDQSIVVLEAVQAAAKRLLNDRDST